MKWHFKKIIFLSSVLFATHAAFADSTDSYFPRAPHLSFWGYSNVQDNNGNGEILIPNYGNNSNLLYTDAQGSYGNGQQGNGWYAGLGEGYRMAISNSQLLGGYVFVDCNVAQSNSIFWMISPGVETIGTVWDARANGYIPVGSQENKTGSTTGGALGIYSGIVYSGHNEYDQIYNTVEETGPGVDAEVGRVFSSFHNLHAYVGGYFFSMPVSSNITGVEGRIEYPAMNHLSILAADTFDNLNHNTFMLGIKVDIGGGKPGSKDIGDHLTDNVDRHLGTLTQGAGVPIQKTQQQTNNLVLTNSNVFFFNSNGTTSQNNLSADAHSNGTINASSCTAENPCSADQFNQANINQINSFRPNVSFYLGPGMYSPNVNLAINPGQSIYGRSADFRTPAYLAGTTTSISGALTLNGNNTIDSVNLLNNNGAQNYGVTIANAKNVTINHSTIGALNSAAGYSTGVLLNNASNVSIQNSTINAYASTEYGGMSLNTVTGLEALNNSNFNLQNDTINVTGLNKVADASLDTIGIFADHSNGIATGTTINDTGVTQADNIGGTGSLIDIDLYSNANSNLIFSGTINSVTTAVGKAVMINNANLFASNSGKLNFTGKLTSTSSVNGDDDGAGHMTTIADTMVLAANNGSVTVNGTINNTSSATGNLSTINSSSIAALNGGNVTLNGIFNDKSTAIGTGANINVTEIFTNGNNSTINFTGTINAVDDATDFVSLTGADSMGGEITVSNSNINLNATSLNTGFAAIVGLSDKNGDIVANNDTMNLVALDPAGQTASVIALQTWGRGTLITADNDTFNMSAYQTDDTRGEYINTDNSNGGTIVDNNDTFNQE